MLWWLGVGEGFFQVEQLGVSQERDPVEVLAMRHIIAAIEPELQAWAHPALNRSPATEHSTARALLTSTGPLLVHAAAHGSIVQVFIHVVAVASALGRAVPQSRWPDGLSRC